MENIFDEKNSLLTFTHWLSNIKEQWWYYNLTTLLTHINIDYIFELWNDIFLLQVLNAFVTTLLTLENSRDKALNGWPFISFHHIQHICFAFNYQKNMKEAMHIYLRPMENIGSLTNCCFTNGYQGNVQVHDQERTIFTVIK